MSATYQPNEQPLMNPALYGHWQTKADIKVLKGGRASSKTFDAAGMAIYLARNFSLKFLCMRQFQANIRDSVHAILAATIIRFGFEDEFIVLERSIVHKATGSSFHFFGIARDIAQIKGFEACDIAWIEEAEALTKTQWATIEPTIRRDNSEIWVLYNPRLCSDFAETFFKHDPANQIIVRHINYDENPFLSDKMRRTIERSKKLDIDAYGHIYLGIPLSDDDLVIIKRSWLEACVDAHLHPPIAALIAMDGKGQKRLGFDVADGGKDLCATVLMEGIVAVDGEEWKGKEDELLISCTRVYNAARRTGAKITYDSIGVGAHAGGKFSELNEVNGTEIKYDKFNAGGKVIDPDEFYIEDDDNPESNITNDEFFCNVKAQGWVGVADRARNTYNMVKRGEVFELDELISLSSLLPMLDHLITELSTPRRDFAKNSGKTKVEAKEDLAKRDVDSPNYADAFIMANAPTEAIALGVFDIDWH
jgi:phage terminase large subunit